MRLKLYRAPTVTAAMGMIRRELGEDALILTTRRVAGGVEVAAALEVEACFEASDSLQISKAPEGELAQLARIPPSAGAYNRANRASLLSWHGVGKSLATSLEVGDLESTLALHLVFAPLRQLDRLTPLMVAGPPGSGKTMTVARLATRLTMSGSPPVVITADGRRAGATEQLAALTEILGVRLIVADQPALLARVLACREQQPVLIDTPGIDAASERDRELISDLAAASGAITALVLPAGLDPNEAADLAMSFSASGATHLVATRLDLCRRLGGILMAAYDGRLALAEAGVGADVADSLAVMTPLFLAQRLLAVSVTTAPARLK